MPSVRQVLAWKIGLSLLFTLPLLFLPLSYFPDIEIPDYDAASLIFLRLLGAAYGALLVVEAWGCFDPGSLRAAVIAAVAETTFAALWVWHFVFYGYLSNWPVLGKVLLLGAGVMASLFALLLLVCGSGALLGRSSAAPVASPSTPSSTPGPPPSA